MTPTRLMSVDIAGAKRALCRCQLLLFFPSWSCTIICCINWFTSQKSPMKRLNIRSFQSTLWLSSAVATVLTENSLYFIFSPGSFCSSNVYRHESGRCHTLPFFLNPFQVFFLYEHNIIRNVCSRSLYITLLHLNVRGPFSILLNSHIISLCYHIKKLQSLIF